MEIEKSNQYRELISGIKLQIKNSKQQALLAVNKELLILYWGIENFNLCNKWLHKFHGHIMLC